MRDTKRMEESYHYPSPQERQQKCLQELHGRISLLSVPGKAFGKILNDRMRSTTEGKIMEEQVGLRPRRGCVENVFVIRQLAEKMLERGKRLYAALLDLEKAYDRVWRAGLWEALKQYGVKGRLLRTVQGLYKDSEATVKVGEEIADWFEVQREVRQGCRCHHGCLTYTWTGR